MAIAHKIPEFVDRIILLPSQKKTKPLVMRRDTVMSLARLRRSKNRTKLSLASLLGENSVSGDEDKANHKGTGSVPPVSQTEKWSHEAIVARANARPERMQKLKVAANSLQNPGFDFLQECWDDPALQIVLKKLLAKFGQWGIAVVAGVLVDWEE